VIKTRAAAATGGPRHASPQHHWRGDFPFVLHHKPSFLPKPVFHHRANHNSPELACPVDEGSGRRFNLVCRSPSRYAERRIRRCRASSGGSEWPGHPLAWMIEGALECQRIGPLAPPEKRG